MSYMANRVAGFGTTIFTEMTAMAREYNAINLGQGFPDFAAPDFIKEAARASIAAEVNQYSPANGRLDMREALAAKVARQYGIEIDPNSQINIVHGATEAIFATIMGLVNPGEEVIIFEPYYDSYVPAVIMAGGIPVYYTLHAPDFAIDRDKLARLFNVNTKAIMINTPHNPIGKVYTREELTMIAELCQAHDVIAVVDEVYEHIVFNGRFHLSMSTLPGMADRTVTISSIGKTYSVTGWKTGWTIASPELTTAVFRAHQFITFSTVHPMQHAAAAALAAPDSYYTELTAMYQQRRDFLADALRAAGLPPIVPAGTYFMMVDISDLGFANDREFCYYLTKEIGVAAIPPSAFYVNPADGAKIARFAFCKSMGALEEAANRLQKLRQR
ncbi:MAG: aminotransferase class I/II-fold pyridoxal phosphate-dependent enzyme [Anaerolineales bacterium]|nr:aminotransferase class I/II-fold pyridoxal phosphate-dependent enzyme [Anaerolineales bacterium]